MKSMRVNDVRREAFTLVELLVVIGIIAILAGLSTAGLQVAQRNSEENSAKHEISLLKTAIEAFSQETGDYPPTRFAALKVRGVNSTNEGNECLFVCLQIQKHGGPFATDLDESRWMNSDKDKLPASAVKRLESKYGFTRSQQLAEYTDSWGNPYVYIHNSDYGKEFSYRLPDGKTIRVSASKSELGGYASPNSFQLWSLGYDAKNSNGSGDDICSWKS